MQIAQSEHRHKRDSTILTIRQDNMIISRTHDGSIKKAEQNWDFAQSMYPLALVTIQVVNHPHCPCQQHSQPDIET